MNYLEIIKKLVGDIGSAGKSDTSGEERLKNMKEMCDLAKTLLYHIDNSACQYLNPKEHYAKEIQNTGIEFLEEIGFRD